MLHLVQVFLYSIHVNISYEITFFRLKLHFWPEEPLLNSTMDMGYLIFIATRLKVFQTIDN